MIEHIIGKVIEIKNDNYYIIINGEKIRAKLSNISPNNMIIKVGNMVFVRNGIFGYNIIYCN